MFGSSFDSKAATVAQLLGDGIPQKLVVPEFQRGYEWGKKHVDAFWNDLKKFFDEDDDESQDYFLGPIVIHVRSDQTIHLLDGQQRLATTTILLSVIRDLAHEVGINESAKLVVAIQSKLIEKDDDGYSLTMSETDRDFFRDFIQNTPRGSMKPVIRTNRNIKLAREILYSKLKPLTEGNPSAATALLRRWRDNIRHHLIFATLPVSSEREAFRIFETLNDRGLRLSVPDLLLNYLMREADPESSRRDIRSSWTHMIQQMGKRDINSFIRHMWVSKYGDLKSKDLFSAIKERVEEDRMSSLEFVSSCAEECSEYLNLLTYSEEALGDRASVHVKNILGEIGKKASLPLLLSGVQHLPAADFEKLCQWLLVYITRHSIIANIDTADFENVVFGLAKNVRQMLPARKDSPKKEIAACMKHIREVFENSAPNDAQLKILAEKELSRDGALYVVTKLAEYLHNPSREKKSGESNLEHIFPQNPEDAEWGGPANHAILQPLLWNLGNLTLFGKRANTRAGNKEFKVKAEEYRKSGWEITNSIPIHYSEWNPKAIKARAKAMMDKVVLVWGFENSSQV